MTGGRLQCRRIPEDSSAPELIKKSVEGRDTFFPLRVREPAAISEAALGAAVIRIYSS